MSINSQGILGPEIWARENVKKTDFCVRPNVDICTPESLLVDPTPALRQPWVATSTPKNGLVGEAVATAWEELTFGAEKSAVGWRMVYGPPIKVALAGLCCAVYLAKEGGGSLELGGLF